MAKDGPFNADDPRYIGAACPNCQAPPGEPCTQPTDESRVAIRTFHYARGEAYRKEHDR
jgi:hypothetical protein